MSEHVFKFMLGELDIVRVVCRCGVVVEVPIEKLDNAFPLAKCQLCGTTYDTVVGKESNLAKLVNAIMAIRREKDNFRVEFVLPDHSGK